MLGSTLKKLRAAKKLTQLDLSQWLGVSRQTIAMWETNKRKINIFTLRKISHAFGISVDKILSEQNSHVIKKEIEMPVKQKKTTKSKIKKINFELLAPEAKNVFLTGDFTDWKENGIKMKKSRNGLWKKEVPLKIGRHEYKFIVDNQWWTDPQNHNSVNNSFGDINSVMDVTT